MLPAPGVWRFVLSLGVLPSCLLRDGYCVLGFPSDGYLSPALLERVRGRHFEVLADDLKLSAGIELDQVAGHTSRVRHVADHTALGSQTRGVILLVEQPDLLGPNREARSVALDEV